MVSVYSGGKYRSRDLDKAYLNIKGFLNYYVEQLV